jgi:cytochrome d ubiquinol oxidase subunit II
VAIGNILRGLELNEIGDYTAGFFALLNPFALMCGLTGLTMFALQGALYLAMKLEGEIVKDVRRWAATIWYVFMPLLLLAVTLGVKNCIHGMKALPMVLALLSLVSSSAAFMFNRWQKSRPAFLASSCTIAFVMLAVAAALFPNMVPCTNNAEWSLTVFNSSSSQLTLVSMLVIALVGMPIVLAYTWFIHHVFRGKVTVSEE